MRKGLNSHLIDLIFPIAVFFVFAVSSLAALVLAANIYQDTTDSATNNFTERTATAYVLEKVRQNDINGQVDIIEKDGVNYLVMAHEESAPSYTIYIYSYDGKLREMRLADNIEPSPSLGTEIAPLADFYPEIEDSLLRFTFTYENGEKTVLYAGERSVR